MKMSKIGIYMESVNVNADFFQLSAKTIKSFNLSNNLGTHL